MKYLSSTIVLLALVAVSLTACFDGGIQQMTAKEFAPLFETGAIVIDVRTQEEYDAGHVFQSVQVDFRRGDFAEIISVLQRDKTYYIYCENGNRSQQAAETMRGLGFTNLVNIGGYEDLKAAGVPVRPE